MVARLVAKSLLCALAVAGAAGQSRSPAPDATKEKPLTPWYLPGDPRAAQPQATPATSDLRTGTPVSAETRRQLAQYETEQLQRRKSHNLPKPEKWQNDYVKHHGANDGAQPAAMVSQLPPQSTCARRKHFYSLKKSGC